MSDWMNDMSEFNALPDNAPVMLTKRVVTDLYDRLESIEHILSEILTQAAAAVMTEDAEEFLRDQKDES